ncbi:hypothetical protein [Jutongia sp.]
MKIIEGKQAVVKQIETKTAVQDHAAQAVCRGVLEPEYQMLHYHGVKQEKGKALQAKEQVIPAKVYAADEGRHGVSGADIVTPVIAEETLGWLERGTILKELFAGAGSRREG